MTPPERGSDLMTPADASDTRDPLRGAGGRGAAPPRAAADRLETTLRIIEDATIRLNRITDVAEICDTIVDEAAALLDADTYRVYLVDDRARVCSLIACRDREGREPPYDVRFVALGKGVTGWVAERGVPLLLRDASRDMRTYWVDGPAEPKSMILVPMAYEGRVAGLIVLDRLGVGRYDEDDLTTMNIVAGHAAQALRHADTYDVLTRQREEMAQRVMTLRSLLEITTQLQGKRDMAEALEFIADSLQQVVANDALLILRPDRAAGLLRPVICRDPANQVTDALPLDAGLSGWVFEHAEPVLANDAARDPRTIELPGTLEEEDTESLIVVPLISDGSVLGTLNVTRIGEGRGFTDLEFDITKLFAAQAAAALHAAERFDAVERHRRELERHVAAQRMLFEVNRQLLSTLEPQAVLDTIADSLATLVRHDSIAFYRADTEQRLARCFFARGKYAEQRLADLVPLDAGITGRVVASGDAALANDAHLEAGRRDVPGTIAGEPESVIVVPLVAPLVSRGIIGSLLLARVGGDHRFSEAEFELVKLFAAQASIALQNAERFASVRAGTRNDPG